MFTGIIRELGTVERCARAKGLVRLAVRAPKTASRVEPLESVAVNGVCLSVVEVRRATLVFEMIGETQAVTTLTGLRPGSRVHLEPSLTLVDRLNGHLLFGHVDGTGTLVTRRQATGELVLTIRIARALRRFLVEKGPVALDGVSLTVGKTLTPTTFTVHLIPETLRQTTLRTLAVGGRVNVELDYLAKLVSQFTRPGMVTKMAGARNGKKR